MQNSYGTSTLGARITALVLVLVACIAYAGFALPKVSMAGSDAWNGQYELRVTCKNEAGYIGYDIYGVSGLVNLGYFQVGETKTIYLDAPNCGGNWTIRKKASSDGLNWSNVGGTHSANVCKPESMWDWDIVGCPVDIVVSPDPGSAGAVVSWSEPTVTSTCCGSGLGATTQTHSPGDTFPMGTTPVAYTWTDADGDTRTCTFNVTVLDGTPPTVEIISPADGTSYPTETALFADWIATDDSGPVTVTATAAVGSPVDMRPGCRTFTVTATDAAGNTTTVTSSYCVRYVMEPGYPLDFAGGGGSVGGEPGYVDVPAGGGGETGGAPIGVAFRLTGANGVAVVDAVADLTVVAVTLNEDGSERQEVLLPLYIFEYDPQTDRYVTELTIADLASGVYDLWIALPDATHRVIRVENGIPKTLQLAGQIVILHDGMP